MIPEVVQVKPNDDFTVYVYFCDGKIKLYDVKPLLNKGVFKKISERNRFKEICTVMNGTLAWDLSGKFDESACIDIDPIAIYEKATDAEDPMTPKVA